MTKKQTKVAMNALPFNKLCNLEDFRHRDLGGFINEMYPDHVGQPIREHRKHWETAMIARAVHEFCPRAAGSDRYLGVGAGMERSVFFLTLMGTVHATDLYGGAGMWSNVAPQKMLLDPISCAPTGYAWEPDKLIVQHMDARALRYPDNYFDAVFSSSSIEHFGSLADVAQAMREMNRVLKPGGIIALATEFSIDPKPIDKHGWPGVIIFDRNTLEEFVIESSGCELVDELDLSVSEASRATNVTLIDAIKNNPLPHVVLNHEGYTFTSVSLVMRKPE
jgi:SAM-dependent methyltransferase